MIRSWLIAIPCLLASGVQASAGCTIASVVGNWTLYTLSSEGPTQFTTTCDVTITNRGRASGQCVDSFGGQGAFTATLKVFSAPRCTFNGTMTQFGDKYSLNLVSVSRDRSVVSGVGSSDTGVFVLNAVKQ
jgi:hypothetical protein